MSNYVQSKMFKYLFKWLRVGKKSSSSITHMQYKLTSVFQLVISFLIQTFILIVLIIKYI